MFGWIMKRFLSDHLSLLFTCSIFYCSSSPPLGPVPSPAPLSPFQIDAASVPSVLLGGTALPSGTSD